MTNRIPSDSVGIVEPKEFHFDEPLELASGRELPYFDLIVETYGELNIEKSNEVGSRYIINLAKQFFS